MKGMLIMFANVVKFYMGMMIPTKKNIENNERYLVWLEDNDLYEIEGTYEEFMEGC